jgi:D-serine deaminase-like pyridoxal phosphate-dependent protein
VPALIQRALARDGFAGVLGFTLAEALWLVEHGITDDVVLGYPTVDRSALDRLLDDPQAAAAITLMVDQEAHLDVVDSVRRGRETTLRLALDVDAGLRLGPQHIGPKRSSLYDVGAVTDLARRITTRPGFRLAGVMTYEGQVAGVPDRVPRQRARSLAVRRIKQASITQLAVRRQEIAEALAELTTLEFWNGGGSGSVEDTAADSVVTEVAAGSGLLAPTLFDHYESFRPRPAAFFALPVTRRPTDRVVTVHGGGLVASGAAGKDRLPTPWLPPGLHLTGLEGAGEVQTPLTGRGTATLAIGDLVWFRHAKSGELFEHGRTVRLLSGSRFVDEVSTYRGEGLAL